MNSTRIYLEDGMYMAIVVFLGLVVLAFAVKGGTRRIAKAIDGLAEVERNRPVIHMGAPEPLIEFGKPDIMLCNVNMEDSKDGNDNSDNDNDNEQN